jgi:hypothetical protein
MDVGKQDSKSTLTRMAIRVRPRHERLEQRRMEAFMVAILLIGVLVVLVFLCLAGPGGEAGSRHGR